MEIIETAVFSKQMAAAWTDEEFRTFQLHLLVAPHSGVVIPGSGGLRKIRWRMPGRGKRGGARVIYYWQESARQIYLLFMYPKNARSDLSRAELRVLRRLIEME